MTFHVGDLVWARTFYSYAYVIGYYTGYSERFLVVRLLDEAAAKKIRQTQTERVLHTFLGPVSA